MSNRYSIIEIAEAMQEFMLIQENNPHDKDKKNDPNFKPSPHKNNDKKEKTKNILTEKVKNDTEKDKDNNPNKKVFPNILSEANYFLLEEQFQRGYGLLKLNQELVSPYFQKALNPEKEEFYKKKEFSDTGKETLDSEEAREAVEDILYQASAHTNEMDLNTKQKFNNWQQLNKALLFLYSKTSPIQTSEVNYDMKT